MLQSVYAQIKKEIFEEISIISDTLHDRNGEPTQEDLNRVVLLIRKCESGLAHANNAQQFYEILDVASSWNSFLSGYGVRSNFRKPLDKEFLFSSESFEDDRTQLSPIAGSGKLLVGTALRDSLDKTVPIRVYSRYKHERTGKYVTKSKKYLVHDEFNEVSIGDVIEVCESRPTSKRKSFVFLRKLNLD